MDAVPPGAPLARAPQPDAPPLAGQLAQGDGASQAEGLPGMVAEVYSPRCDGCGACAEVCPVEAIAVSVLATIDAWGCTGCGRCVAACPRQAIVMRER